MKSHPSINVSFTPVNHRQGNIKVGPLSSTFFQPFGHFEGQLKGHDGVMSSFKGMRGVTEEHQAYW
jgi:hypothetical protein